MNCTHHSQHMNFATRWAVMALAFTWGMTTGATTLSAQVSDPVANAINTARGHINSGDGVVARAMLDSLLKQAPRASDDLAEVLYWRAVMSEQVSDAEKDWKRLIVDVPLSPRTPDALLRLGELEILRGQPVSARSYYERIIRDFANSPQQSKAMLWTARSYFEERNFTDACAAVAAVRASGTLVGEQQLQSNEMQGRCDENASRQAAVNASPSSSAPATEKVATAAKNTSTGSGVFTVQLAAYDTKSQATAAVKRFKTKGVNAHIDGTRKPFRVRVGRYGSHDAAASVLARLKKLGHSGFVAELDK